MGRQIPANGRECLAPFLSIAPVSSVPETAEPLRTVRLRHRGACPDHLSSFASPVTRGAHIIQPTKGLRKLIGLGQGALAGRLARAINVKDLPGVSRSIHQFSRLLVGSEWASEQIIEKER